MKTNTLARLSFAIGLALASSAAAQDHARHRMPAMQDHSQHQVPVDHAQHQETPPTEHLAMDMPRISDQPVTPIPALTDADRAAAVPPPGDHPVHDDSVQSFVLFNRLEGFDADEGRGLQWEGQAWVGTDLDKLWLRSEGERLHGRTEAADVELLYGHSIARWWDLVAGVRHDFQPDGSRDFAAFGVQGLAPYKFEVEATAYVGASGRSAARLEVEYDMLLTNRLILQPLVEANFNGQNDAHRGIGSGLGTIEGGLRLRYEVTRQFAPYIGVVRERAFGNTADFRRDAGGDIDDTRLVAGLRIWF
jgi:copper resistance protein B